MKKSTRTGLILSLGLTMSSSLVIGSADSNNNSYVAVQITQASSDGSSVNLEVPHRPVYSATERKQRMTELVSRIREQLLETDGSLKSTR